MNSESLTQGRKQWNRLREPNCGAALEYPGPALEGAKSIWPHEIVFGGFLLFAWVRLTMAGTLGTAPGWWVTSLLAANSLLICAAWWRPTVMHGRLRLWFYPLAMNLAYMSMNRIVAAVHPGLVDSTLQQLDQAWFGGSVPLSLRGWQHPWLTEILSFCYALFFPYLFCTILDYLSGPLDTAKAFASGCFTIYGLGFIGYLCLPARGPYLEFGFARPAPGYLFTRFNEWIVGWGSNGVDVFPSLHCALTLFFLLFDRNTGRRRWRWLSVPCAGLWFSTLYLGYHYLVDVIAGFVLGAFGFWVATRFTNLSTKKE